MWDRLYCLYLFNASQESNSVVIWRNLQLRVNVCWVSTGGLHWPVTCLLRGMTKQTVRTTADSDTVLTPPSHCDIDHSFVASTITLSSILVLWSILSSYSRLPVRLVSPQQLRRRSWFLMKILSSFSSMWTLWYRWEKSPRTKI